MQTILNKKCNPSYVYWGIFISIMLLKYGYYGFEYFPVMDDWIQYGTYSKAANAFNDVILKTKLYTVRPFAGMIDIYVIGKLWNHMGIVFFLMIIFHTASAYFFTRIFKYNGIKTGYVFLIIYGLLPFGSEATYWISASSRLVVGMFLTSVSLFFLCKFIYSSKRLMDLALYLIFGIMSVGFYEPIVILAFVGTLLIIVPNIKRYEGKIAAGVFAIPYIFIGYYYNYFSNEGQMTSRGHMAEKGTTIDYNKIYGSILEMLSNSDIYFYTKGFKRGLNVIIHDKSVIFMFLVITAAIGVYMMIQKAPRERKFFANIKKIILGLILFCVPFSIFFIISFNWISFRNAFTSFVGLALIVEAVLDIFSGDIVLKRAKSFIMAGVVIFFIIINISELSDFRAVSNADKEICTGVILASEGTGYRTGEKLAFLLNSGHSYSELNKNYHEHINSVTNSYWLLTGTLRGISGDLSLKNIVPIPVNEGFKLLPEDYHKYVLLGIEDDRKVSLLTYERKGKYLYSLFRLNGELYGEIEYRYGLAFFSKK